MQRTLRTIAMAAVAVLAASGVARAQAQGPATETQPTTAAATGNLRVTVDYKGAGPVDASHRIWIWLFQTPNITAESVPIATGSLAANKTDYKFTTLPGEVYIAVAYDEKGTYDGTAGPPPPGTPVAIHGASALGEPASPVATGGADASVTVTFDDSMRMPTPQQ